MPARPADSERSLGVALAAVRGALDRAGAPWMVIGGVALIVRGVRRMTTDLDVVVRGDAVELDALLAALAAAKIVPRIADAVPFAQKNLVLLLKQ
ncbi:MAG: hypothetical protein U0414_43345 [Polyangiaceae bacterium]